MVVCDLHGPKVPHRLDAGNGEHGVDGPIEFLQSAYTVSDQSLRQPLDAVLLRLAVGECLSVQEEDVPAHLYRVAWHGDHAFHQPRAIRG